MTLYNIPDPGSIRSDELAKLASRALFEFSDVADYVWKSPRLIEQETKVELQKLDLYFPERRDLAELRWKLESRKLHSVFPYLIAVGNLFTIVSLFEVYLLLLHELVKGHIPVNDQIRGQGVDRTINYLKQTGVGVESLFLYEQVQAARRIRNCLVHAAGVLSNSRNELEIRRIQTTKIYFDPALRKKSIDDETVTVVDSPLGDRLQITNSYSHLACSYVRDFFINLCKAVDDKHISIP